MTIFVTGGAGFIGSAVVRALIKDGQHRVVNIDNLSYASNLNALDSVASSERYLFKKTDICDLQELGDLFSKYRPKRVINLAAQSHVDRSIDRPAIFIQTNIVGTFNLLEASRSYLEQSQNQGIDFRFHHISTDEVYGALGTDNQPFNESANYRPSSPYSASKASSDHLVRAWGRTYEIPYVITNCSNNYGPWQYPEKLIPYFVYRALNRESLPVYGNGNQIRDWLHVDDHVSAIMLLLEKPLLSNHYNIGANNERSNMQIVESLCSCLEQLDIKNDRSHFEYRSLIIHVEDRAGHDKRYAINSGKLENELNWKANIEYEVGIKQTVEWYYQQFHSQDSDLGSIYQVNS